MSDNFIKDTLKPILNTDVDDEIVQYIKKINTLEDFDEFISNIIEAGNLDHVKLCNQLKEKLFNGCEIPPPNKIDEEPLKAIKNDSSVSGCLDLGPSTIVHGNTPQNNNKDIEEKFTRLNLESDVPSGFSNTVKEKNTRVTAPIQKEIPIERKQYKGAEKKTKFTNVKNYMYLPLRKGRYPCDCQATDHALINNCLNCGRIVCEQEGSGPCFHCNSMVCTNEEMMILELNTKDSDKLYNKLQHQKKTKEWIQAVERRDKLLNAERTGKKMTTIIDDDTDFFESRPRISRKDMKLALDLINKTVVIQEDEFQKSKPMLLQKVEEQLSKGIEWLSQTNPKGNVQSAVPINRRGKVFMKPRISDDPPVNKYHQGVEIDDTVIKSYNPELTLRMDFGMCLSMHQPWASLLVSGVKVHEGRTWETDHRGKLWIHAASKQPDPEEVAQLEAFYREHYKDFDLTFPEKYPTGCLLGCVFVEDCLSQEEYRQKYPNGESDSPYVLICKEPMVLPVFYPMQGDHKIFRLTKDMHNIVKDALLVVGKNI